MEQDNNIDKNPFKILYSVEKIDFLSPQEQQEFESQRKSILLKKGEILFKEGQTPEGVYYIKEGTAKLYKIGFNNKEQILRFIQKEELTGYRSILCKESFGATAMAMDNMEILFIPEKYFMKALEHDSRLGYHVLKNIAHELGEASKTITILAQKTVRERLAEILLLLENKLGVDTHGFINITLTREEVANLVGTATESAIRLISEFKADQLVEVDGRKIKILEHQKLTRLARIGS